MHGGEQMKGMNDDDSSHKGDCATTRQYVEISGLGLSQYKMG